MADKVKVVGYAQRVFYDNGIEYRNFSDDLVGRQLVSDGGRPTFTSGNFVVSTNLDRKPSKIFNTKKFSEFVCLEDMKSDTSIITTIIQNSVEVKLNLNKSNLCNYAYFGSLMEFVRVSLENIIITWPASLKLENLHPIEVGVTGYTIENNIYNLIEDTSTFTVPTDLLRNSFNINYLTNGSVVDTFNETNDLRNLATSYDQYVINIDDNEYQVIGFSGATNPSNDNLKFIVKGDILSGASETIKDIHIKPNSFKVEEFFLNLPDFESNLLNRFVSPKYTSTYEFFTEAENGAIIKTNKTLTWTTTDGYNIDFDTPEYINFVTELLELAESNDLTKTDLMVRHLTAESISDFDTFPTCDGNIEETAGQKMNKSLKIYGREYDEIKRFVDGIAFANSVTYNKVENTPDVYLKNLGRVMGWELVSSVLENDLLNMFLNPSDSTYGGHSRGLTSAEAEIELWRRIILNTPWIWKSKGTRKAVEFLFDFIGTPNGLVAFNEYIYKVKKPLDITLFKDILDETVGDTNIDDLNIDSDGYPKFLPNTSDMYFQKAGLWFRETAGSGSTIDILRGNNPHIGPYDGGQAWIDQLGCLIPDFSAVTVYNETISTGTTNIFTNYNSGLVNNAPETEVWAEIVNLDNLSLSDCYELTAEIIEDPKPSTEMTDCGCETGEGDESIKISVKKLDSSTDSSPSPITCGYTGFTLDEGGFVVFQLPNGKETFQITQECCEAIGFTYQTGEINCYWGSDTSTPNRTCNGFEPNGDYLPNGVVIWENSELQIGATEVSLECCESYGFTAVLTESGNYNCFDNQQRVDCENYVYTSVNSSTGIITWQNPPNKSLTTIIPSECCVGLGYRVGPNNDCIDPNALTSGDIATRRGDEVIVTATKRRIEGDKI